MTPLDIYYARPEDIAELADIRLGPGTLYGAIARLESRGLIEAVDSQDRRNPYRLTANGERALRLRLKAIETVARAARRRLSTSEA